MRIGTGYDAHRFAQNRRLILGGVDIAYEMGLSGVSDADVLVHAIMDALLGAAALGDIGMHFPPSDGQYKDIDSMVLLGRVADILKEKKYKVGNIDSVVIAQRPHISKYILQMRENIARVLGIDTDAVSVKATTTEGMGFEGKGEGIGAQAVCLLEEM